MAALSIRSDKATGAASASEAIENLRLDGGGMLAMCATKGGPKRGQWP